MNGLALPVDRANMEGVATIPGATSQLERKQDMQSTGQHVVFEGVGQAALRRCEIPSPKAGDVLVESLFTAISAGTERANLMALPNTGTAPGGYNWKRSGGFPFHPGYCGVGRIAACGEGVETLKVGDRVVGEWAGHRSHFVRKAGDLIRIDDDGVDALDASLARIAVFALLGVRKLRIELGESVLIAGQGLLGVFALQAAALSGAVPVFVSDFNPARRELAMKLGATAAFAPDEQFVERVLAATAGKGVDGVVEVTGIAKALQQALECVAWEGRISLLGCTRISDVPIDFYRYVHRRGVSLIGAHNSTRPALESSPWRRTEADDYRIFLKLVAAGKMRVRPVISEVVSPEKAPEVYARLADDPDAPLGVVFDWGQLKA